MIWILDASVAVRWFLREEEDRNAREVLQKVVSQPRSFSVPELFAFEVFAVLQRLHPHPDRAFVEGVLPILQGGLLRVPMSASLARIAGEFVSRGLTGYDACYAALASDLGGLWLTYDARVHATVADSSVSFLLGQGMPSDWDRG